VPWGDGLGTGGWERRGKPLLLIRDDKWTSWVSLGAIGAEHADWLRQLAASKRSASMRDAEREA
jgi:hypothetical protein